MPQKKANDAGSQFNSEPAFLIVGKLRRAHGVHGEIPLEIYTSLLDLLSPDRVVYIGESHQPYTIEKTRWKNELILLKFKEINDRTLVSELTNSLAYVRTADLAPLPDGEFYMHELIGVKVVDQEGADLGVLTEILETGANDVYLVEGHDGEEFLFPAIPDVILEIDLEEGVMIVAPQDWYGEGD